VGISYREAGVDIQAGEEAVRQIKSLVKTTFTADVLTDLGSFGGCFQFNKSRYRQPVLVSSTDGVGTKLLIARQSQRYDTIGQCLVNHCVNDILTTGARPLFFLDYIGVGRLRPDRIREIISGLTVACRENGCALIGGEMAEMPGIYQSDDFDLAGTIVGVVEKNRMLFNRVTAGDRLIGLTSTGLHTNGYSLARRVLLNRFEMDTTIPELGETLAETLLKVHRSYLPVIRPFINSLKLHAISHITGGGIEGNTRRVLTPGLRLQIDWDAWEWPPIFQLIQRAGEIATEEMRRVFNLGIGMILVVAPEAVRRFTRQLMLAGECPVILGEVVTE